MDQTANRGVKRKRYEPPKEQMSVRIGGKFHHETKEVHKASKRAKVLETQKVVKRLKNLRKKDETDEASKVFEAELKSLKEIDHDAVGNSAFKTKILKDYTLKENEGIKAAMAKEFENQFLVPADPGSTLAKIQSRLLSSKILATQITASLESLKFLLNPALKQADINTSKEEDITIDQSPSRPTKVPKGPTSADPPTQSKIEKHESPHEYETEDGDEDDGEEGSVSSRDGAGWESGSVSGDGILGAGDGWESGSIGDVGSQEEDSDDNESESSDEELQVQPIKNKPQKPVAKPAKGASSKMESTFLPSLSVGFVRGGDDSDFSDAEGLDADLPKKNRRGQRARQAIWEKKYGRNANHKKKEAEIIATLPTGKNRGHASKIKSGPNAIPSGSLPSAPPYGPSGSTKDLSRGRTIQPAVDAGWGSRSTGTSIASVFKPVPARDHKNNDEKPLHPSWEAKRRLKEKESAGIVPSQGTKIKFS